MANTIETRQFLSYTNLSFPELVKQIQDRLRLDPRFANFRESAIAQTTIEIFSALTDFINYYLERRAEEQFLDTAQLKSSIISLAKQLGYVVTRPVPAEAEIKLILSKQLDAGIVDGDKIEFPAYSTVFTYEGIPFVLKNNLQYTVTQDDIDAGEELYVELAYMLPTTGADYEVISGEEYYDVSQLLPIKAIQGEIVNYNIDGITNNQIGQKFQTYKIADKTFSNKYGTEDYGAGDITDVSNICVVKIGATEVGASQYEVLRRSLYEKIDLTGQTQPKVCLLRTSPDESVEILFGDANYAELGAKTSANDNFYFGAGTIYDNIYVQYLSTLGQAANTVGVIGKKLQSENSIQTNTMVDVTNNFEFQFNGNIIGGSDLEEAESIKLNSPAIFYSLDRLVTSTDYVNYLKSLLSPVDIKNAICWGEQQMGGALVPIPELFNVVLFSCLGSLYNIDTSNPLATYDVKTDEVLDADSLLDDNYDPYKIPKTSFYNVYTKKSAQAVIANTISNIDVSTQISNLVDVLDKKSQTVVKNVYISPVIQDFTLTGTIYINRFASKTETNKKIGNAIYEFMDKNADYNVPVYKSNLLDIIEGFSEVNYANIGIIQNDCALVSTFRGFDYSTTASDSDLSAIDNSLPISVSAIRDIYIRNIDAYFADVYYQTSAGFSSVINYNFSTQNILNLFGIPSTTALNQDSFYTILLKNIYQDIYNYSPYLTLTFDTQLTNIADKLQNELWYFIREGMMDDFGNILSYSLKTEIPRLYFTPTYTYIA